MNWIRRIVSRLRGTLNKRRFDAEMAEEMRQHFELRIERNLASGMPPEEARYAAQRSFGGIEQIKERSRDARGGRWLQDLFTDVRYGVRQLRKTPGFSVVAVASLALGIGANTAIFSLVDDQLLHRLPVKNPDDLVLFEWLPGPHGGRPHQAGGSFGASDVDGTTGQEMTGTFSLRTFNEFRGASSALADVFAMAPLWNLNVSLDRQSEIRTGQLVSGNYYAVLGVPAMRGRTLRLDDDRPGAPPVAVISERYWRTRFAGDPAVVGKTFLVNRTPVTIVGVTPAAFRGVLLSAAPPEITLPLAMAPQVTFSSYGQIKPGYWWLHLMGRRKPGVTAEQVRDSLSGSFQASARDSVTNPNDLPRLWVVPCAYGKTAADRAEDSKSLLFLLGMTGLLLLVACANVANLLLARGAVRRRELAMRLALGASRGRLIRQLLTESVLLALLGAGLGLLFSGWGLDLMATMLGPADREMFEHLSLNLPVLGFAAAMGLITGIGFGFAPALRAAQLDLTAEFQGGPRSLGGTRSRLSQALMVAQVALSLVLLVIAGLFVRTLRNLQAVDIGFDRARLLLFSVDGTSVGYRDQQCAALYAGLADKLAALPGVRSATFSAWPLVSGYGGESSRFTIPGQPAPGGRVEDATMNRVGPDFFETYGMPILLGRGLAAQDSAAAPRVAVVNQALVKKYFDDEDPIGRQIRVQEVMEIVGVVRDVKQADLRALIPPTVFLPFTQSARGEAHFAVRTEGDPVGLIAAIRNAAADVDGNMPVVNVRTQAEQVEWRLTGERLSAKLSGFLGLVALALACVGLYGLMSYLVLRRTGEIGVRMALGAQPRCVLWLILRESLALVGLGVVIGLGAASAATRLIATMLYDLSATDLLSYSAAALLLVAVASVACLLPARRAASVDPLVALRCE